MIEEKVKDMIVSRYGTVRHFSNKIGLPYTTVDTILRRGLLKSNVLNVLTICKELGISVDSLKDDNTNTNNISNISTKSKTITRREFEYEINSMLPKVDMNEQEKDFFAHALEVICSDKK